MSWFDSAISGLGASFVTGIIGAVALKWTSRRREDAREAAWRRRADELTKLVSRQYAEQITWLRRQISACQRECTRLNKLLNNQQRGREESRDRE